MNTNLQHEIELGFARTLHMPVEELPSSFTNNEAAKLLDTSPGTLAVWRCTKRYKIPYFKIGSNVRYPLFGLVKFKADSLKEV